MSSFMGYKDKKMWWASEILGIKAKRRSFRMGWWIRLSDGTWAKVWNVRSTAPCMNIGEREWRANYENATGE